MPDEYLLRSLNIFLIGIIGCTVLGSGYHRTDRPCTYIHIATDRDDLCAIPRRMPWYVFRYRAPSRHFGRLTSIENRNRNAFSKEKNTAAIGIGVIKCVDVFVCAREVCIVYIQYVSGVCIYREVCARVSVYVYTWFPFVCNANYTTCSISFLFFSMTRIVCMS